LKLLSRAQQRNEAKSALLELEVLCAAISTLGSGTGAKELARRLMKQATD
jgi:hypothetical protein